MLSVYVDVKALYELLSPQEMAPNRPEEGIDPGIWRAHILRKMFLGTVIAELLKEIDKTCSRMSFLEVWRGVRRSYKDLQQSLSALRERVIEAKLETHEIPILQRISWQWRSQSTIEHGGGTGMEVGGGITATSPKIKVSASLSDFDKTLEDAEVYKEYSEIVLQSFPFSDLVSEIKDLLEEARMSRLVVFFDDFSELNYVDQRLFVDVVLSPLNNASNEMVKLKIAGYPGRVYYGKIDPTKIDELVKSQSAI